MISTRLMFFATLCSAVTPTPVSGTALRVAADVVDINQSTIGKTDVCVKFEGALESGLTLTIRVPGKLERREFDEFLIIVNGAESSTTMIESAPANSSGFRHLQLSVTRFDGELDNVEVQVNYTSPGSEPVVQIIDLSSLYASVDSGADSGPGGRNVNCN